MFTTCWPHNLLPAASRAVRGLQRRLASSHSGVYTQTKLSAAQHQNPRRYKFTLVPVETFNGSPVKNLQSLAHKVDTCADDYLRWD